MRQKVGIEVKGADKGNNPYHGYRRQKGPWNRPAANYAPQKPEVDWNDCDDDDNEDEDECEVATCFLMATSCAESTFSTKACSKSGGKGTGKSNGLREGKSNVFHML